MGPSGRGGVTREWAPRTQPGLTNKSNGRRVCWTIARETTGNDARIGRGRERWRQTIGARRTAPICSSMFRANPAPAMAGGDRRHARG